MPGDTLNVFGTLAPNAVGFKCKDSNGVTQTYSKGGGGSSTAEKQVNFIDYDGTLLYSYTKAEINAMTSESDLPANPTHTGLTSQGWNWTLAQIKAQLTAVPDGPVWVGQMYITTSGDTEIDIVLDDPDNLSPWLVIGVNGTVTVDWGDGSVTDTMTGTSVATLKYQQHVYAQTGKYTIKLTPIDTGFFAFSGSAGKSFLRANNLAINSSLNRTYIDKVVAIRLGSKVQLNSYGFTCCYSLIYVTIPSSITNIGTYLFQNCYSLKFIVIPSEVTSINTYVFANCYSLTHVAIPSGVTSISSDAFSYSFIKSITIPISVTSISNSVFSSCYMLTSLIIPSGVTIINGSLFSYCYKLKSFTIPSVVTSIGGGAFNYCYCLTSLTIPSSVTSIGDTAFNYCCSLTSLTIPSSVTSIGGTAFGYCYAISEYHFKRETPPTLGTSAFKNIVSGTIIYVPYSADHSILEAYQTATNWSTYASYMQEEPQS